MNNLYHKIKQHFIPITIPLSFWTTTALIGGITIARLRWHWTSIAPILIYIPLLSVCYQGEQFIKKTTWSVFFFFLGMATYSYHTQQTPSFYKIKRVRLYAQVVDIRYLEGRSFSYKTILKVKKFKHQDTWFKDSFMLAIYTMEEPTCTIGSHISCGTFDITPPADESFTLYLKKEGVAGAVFLKRLYSTEYEIPTFSLQRWLYSYKEKLWNQFKEKMSPITFGFFSSLFLGNRAAVESSLETYKNPFKRWGITHCISRSGMHLIIFLLVWNFLLNFLPLQFGTKNVIISMLLSVYCLLSWSSIPFTRAVTIYFLYKIASFLGLQHHSLNILCIVCSLTVIYNPYYLFALDFQLTFLLSFCLIWIAHILHQRKIFIFQNIALPL